MFRKLLKNSQDRRPAKNPKAIKIRKNLGEGKKICHDCGGSYPANYVSCPRTYLHNN
ncbi:MAG: hypothetical protein ACM3PZ_01965 [Bacillota bacterium]